MVQRNCIETLNLTLIFIQDYPRTTSHLQNQAMDRERMSLMLCVMMYNFAGHSSQKSAALFHKHQPVCYDFFTISFKIWFHVTKLCSRD